jgi:hypothetical protein
MPLPFIISLQPPSPVLEGHGRHAGLPCPGVYTVKSGSLDVTLSLVPGIYNTFVQAWDHCGGIAKMKVHITISATGLRPTRFLYLTTNSQQNKKIWGYLVNSKTEALTLTKQGPLAGMAAAFEVASGGPHLYVIRGRISHR